jgi:hypothetical protein
VDVVEISWRAGELDPENGGGVADVWSNELRAGLFRRKGNSSSRGWREYFEV